MEFNQTRLVYLTDRQLEAINNLVQMRTNELNMAQENPSIIAIYEGILNATRRR